MDHLRKSQSSETSVLRRGEFGRRNLLCKIAPAPAQFHFGTCGFLIVDSRHGLFNRLDYDAMVTSITPIIQQYTPRAHSRVGDRSAYVTLEPDAYLDSTTSATQLAMQTHASPHVAITNGTDSYHRNRWQPECREARSRNSERPSTRDCSLPFRLWWYAINLRRTMRRNPRAGRIHHALTLIWQISLAGEPRHKE
jgi:hypothetical protein